MLFLFYLFYRSIVKLKKEYVSNLPTFFHFDTNGNYYLISVNKNIIINYIICTQDEYKLFQKDHDHDVSYCYDHESKIDDFDKGEIFKKGAYQFVFFFNYNNNYQLSSSNNYANSSIIEMKVNQDSNYKYSNEIKYNNNHNIENIKNFRQIDNNRARISKDYSSFFIRKFKNIIFNNTKNIIFNNNYKKINRTLNYSMIVNNRITDDTNEKNEIIVIFKNPKTNLDLHVYPCLITKPIFASISLLVLLLWIINWILNFTKTCTIHIFLTIIIVDSLIYFFLQSKELYFRNHSDLFTPLMPLRITFLFIFQVLFFSTILMLAKGWFIVHKSLGKLKIFCCFIYSALLALPQLIYQTNFVNKALGASLFKTKAKTLCPDKEISDDIETDSHNNFIDLFLRLVGNYFHYQKTNECSDISLWTSKTSWNIAFIVIGFIGVIFYYRDLIISIEESSEYVIAHLMVISESGIDPYTTPVMEKYIIYKYLSWGILIYLAAQLIVMLITQFCQNYVSFWVQQLLYDIVNTFGIIGTSIVLKLNKRRLNGFMELPSSSDDNENDNEIETETGNDNTAVNNDVSQNVFRPKNNDNMLYSSDNNNSNVIDNVDNIKDSQSASLEANLIVDNNNSNNNSNNSNNCISNNGNDNDNIHINGDTVYHHAPVRMNKRVVSREEIKKFNDSINHRNSLMDDNNNVELNDLENPDDRSTRMVKWEEWMSLPPQPIVSQEKRASGGLRMRRGNNNNNRSTNTDNRNGDIEEDLIADTSI